MIDLFFLTVATSLPFFNPQHLIVGGTVYSCHVAMMLYEHATIEDVLRSVEVG